MAAVLVLPFTACGKEADTKTPVRVTATPTPVPTEAPTAAPTAKPTPVPALEGGPASVDFEDGLYGFTIMTCPTIDSDNSRLSVEEIGGSKVLLVANTFGKKEAYVGFDMDSLFGRRVCDVTEIAFDVAAYGGESFKPIEGKIITYTGEGAATKTVETSWSVYLPNKNPKTVHYEMKSRFVVGEHNYLIIAKTDDVAGNQSMWLDNIKFIDLQGNLVPCDNTVTVSPDSPLCQSGEEEPVYGHIASLNLTYQGDWTPGAVIPAAFFENAQGPVSVVLDTLVINPADWAGIFAAYPDWTKPTAETFVDIDGAGNGVIHFQDDGALIVDDKGATKIAFTISKDAAAGYAANGGMCFPGYNLQVLGAQVSDTTYKCMNNTTYQGDWTPGVAIPGAFFEGATAPVSVTLDALVINPADWAGIFAAYPDWTKPTAETFVDIDGAGNGVIHFQDDGALIVDDKGATKITFTITAEAAAGYAANGGMCFPGYNLQVLSATVSKDTYSCKNNLTYQGDWTPGVSIPGAFFANAEGPVNVVLDALVINPADWAGIFAAYPDWTKPTAETFVDIDGAGNGVIHFQDDGALIVDDKGATKIAFTITKEAALGYAANGGMCFPGYNLQVLGATVSTSRFESKNNLTYQGDWTPGVAIPAAFFADAEGVVTVTIEALVINPADWAGIFAAYPDWTKPTAETFVDIDGTGNGIIHFQDDGALIVDDKGATSISFTITKEAALGYAANGGMCFPGYNLQVISAVVTK